MVIRRAYAPILSLTRLDSLAFSCFYSCGLIFSLYGLMYVLQSFGVIPRGFLPRPNETLYSVLGACLFSAYLAHHTKLIVADKNSKYQINEKDYVLGASK
jgi:FtsH-binding integral membrane protein